MAEGIPWLKASRAVSECAGQYRTNKHQNGAGCLRQSIGKHAAYSLAILLNNNSRMPGVPRSAVVLKRIFCLRSPGPHNQNTCWVAVAARRGEEVEGRGVSVQSTMTHGDLEVIHDVYHSFTLSFPDPRDITLLLVVP